MMNQPALIVDIGNTRSKAALFEQNKIVQKFIADTPETLLSKLADVPFAISIVSTVTELPDYFLTHLEDGKKCAFFSSSTPTPIVNSYQSSATLGSDRLAACCGVPEYIGKREILVIDAGTCTKYNFCNKEGAFIGGGISPGLSMRFKALHAFTNKLPLLHFDPEFEKLTGTNTSESIKMGAQTAWVMEVEHIIAAYKKNYPEIHVVATGGDSEYLQKALKNSIFADPDLIFKGLNNILLFNQQLH